MRIICVKSAVFLCIAVLALILGAIGGAKTSQPSELGAPVSPEIARTLRGGDGASCARQKSVECQGAVNPANGTSCPVQTYYYADADGSDYGKGKDSDYCGTAREGSPGVYDCATVVIELDTCLK